MIQKEKYSIYDAQLKKLVSICNKDSAQDAINALRKSLSVYDDVSDVSDRDLFNKWGYVLLEHTSILSSNNKIDFTWLKKLTNIKVVYSSHLINIY